MLKEYFLLKEKIKEKGQLGDYGHNSLRGKINFFIFSLKNRIIEDKKKMKKKELKKKYLDIIEDIYGTKRSFFIFFSRFQSSEQEEVIMYILLNLFNFLNLEGKKEWFSLLVKHWKFNWLSILKRNKDIMKWINSQEVYVLGKKVEQMDEKCYNLLTNKERGEGRCKECNKLTSWRSFGKGYLVYCSIECSHKSLEVKEKFRETIKRKQEEIKNNSNSNSNSDFNSGSEKKGSCIGNIIEEEFKENLKINQNKKRIGKNNNGNKNQKKNKKIKKIFKSKESEIESMKQELDKKSKMINSKFIQYIPNRKTLKLNCNNCNKDYSIFPQFIYNNEFSCKEEGFCPYCSGKEDKDKNFNEIYEYIKNKINNDFLIEKNKTIEVSNKILKSLKLSKNLETTKEKLILDFFIPELNIGIQYKKLYWNSLQYKPKGFHQSQYFLAKEKGIKLLQIFEDDWKIKKEKVKNVLMNTILQKIVDKEIRNRIIKNNRIIKLGGRDCFSEIIKSKPKREFLQKYHLLGNDSSGLNVGLFLKKKKINKNGKEIILENELVGVLTFRKGGIDKNSNKKGGILELSRLCFKGGFLISGGSQKLWSFFRKSKKINSYLKKNKIKTIKTYSDLCYFNGGIYNKLGFKSVGNTWANYFYYGEKTNNIRQHRFGFRKNVLLDKYPQYKTKINKITDNLYIEKEICRELGFIDIEDAGHNRFIMNL